MRDRRIFVTGATGFVGGALVKRLLASGVAPGRLRLLVRSPERARAAALPAESLVRGDLGDREALARAADGAELAFHVAGAVQALSREEFVAANADGTAAVLAALDARAPGCRLVHVSSLAAAGPSLDGSTSALPPEQCRPRSVYGESKRRGELHVTAGGGRAWVIVRPPVVYGRGDAATKLLFGQVRFPWVGVPWTPRPLSLIHVDDLVHALMLAAEAECSGVVLPVDGPDRRDTDTLVHSLAAALRRKVRLLRVPLAAVWPVALGADLWARVRGRPSIFGRDKLRDMRAPGWVADPAPARDALGFEAAVRVEEGLAAVARQEGWVG